MQLASPWSTQQNDPSALKHKYRVPPVPARTWVTVSIKTRKAFAIGKHGPRNEEDPVSKLYRQTRIQSITRFAQHDVNRSLSSDIQTRQVYFAFGAISIARLKQKAFQTNILNHQKPNQHRYFLMNLRIRVRPETESKIRIESNVGQHEDDPCVLNARHATCL